MNIVVVLVSAPWSLPRRLTLTSPAALRKKDSAVPHGPSHHRLSISQCVPFTGSLADLMKAVGGLDAAVWE